ncbi:MAG: hypothetical protein J6D21_06805 [Clostridia bacterium]|nr:hypothetical protein [Clostridia bacterium]
MTARWSASSAGSRGAYKTFLTPFLLRPKAQKKKLSEKKTPLLRALPEPARFFGKKRGKKLTLASPPTCEQAPILLALPAKILKIP